MSAATGCVELHRAAIFDRGGARRITNLTDLTEVKWGRKRDGKSEAQITIQGRSCRQQAEAIRQIEPSRHELVLYRGDERVWEGPIRVVSTVRDLAVIQAFDIKEYLDYTSLTKDWPGPDAGGPPLMGDRLADIITYELTTPYTMDTNQQAGTVVQRWETIATPIDVLPHMFVNPGSVETTSSTLAFEMTLGEHMDNLVRGGIDYTVIGRALYLWDSDLSLGRVRQMTDADFTGDIEVGRFGTEHVAIAHLSASREGTDGGDERGVGHAGEVNDYYGVWETIVSQQTEEGTATPTQAALNSQAQRALTHRTPVPVEVKTPDGIRLTYDLRITDLVPGVEIPVITDQNIQPVSTTMRLDSMTVTETATGETVGVQLSPFTGESVVTRGGVV